MDLLGEGGVRLEAALGGTLSAFIAREIKDAERGASAGVKAATDGAKNDLRAQVEHAGLGGRLAKTWRGRVYPEGRPSIEAAGFIWSKAPQIISAFDRGATIVPVNGKRFLAIPTENVPPRRRGGGFGSKGSKASPFEVETIFNQDLKFFRSRKGTLLAYVNAVAGRGAKRKFRAPTKGRRSQGRKVERVVMFVLVPQVRVKRLLDVDAVGDRWQGAIPGLILRAWPDRTEAAGPNRR